MARVVVDYSTGELMADEIIANIAKAEGTVISIRANRFVVCSDGQERFTVLFDRRTKFDGELKRGATVMAIGLDLGHNTFRATSVVAEN